VASNDEEDEFVVEVDLVPVIGVIRMEAICGRPIVKEKWIEIEFRPANLGGYYRK